MNPDEIRRLRQGLYAARRQSGDSPEAARAFVERHFARTGFTPEAQELQAAEDTRLDASIDQRAAGGRLRSGVATTLQGLSLGTSDELGGAVRSLPALIPGGQSFGEALDENIGAAREHIDAARGTHPGQSIATEIVGAAAPLVLTGGLSAPASGANVAATTGRLAGATRTLARVAQTPVRGGALLGGAYAFGGAEGNPLERLDDAAIGGATGLAAGGAFVGAGRLLGPVASRAMDLVRPQISRVAEAMPQLGIQSVRDRAVGMLTTAMERAGLKADDLARAAQDARPGETIMELASRTGVDRGAFTRMGIGAAAGGSAGAVVDPGESPVASTLGAVGGALVGRRLPGNSVTRLGRATASFASEGADRIGSFLNERAAGAGQRIRGSIENRTGTPLEDVTATAEELVRRRGANARPAYAAIEGRTVSAETLGDIAQIDEFRDAYEAGRQIARLEGVELPDLPPSAAASELDAILAAGRANRAPRPPRSTDRNMAGRSAAVRINGRTYTGQTHADAWESALGGPMPDDFNFPADAEGFLDNGNFLTRDEMMASLSAPSAPAPAPAATEGGIPVRAIDYMKRGLDDLIERGFRGGNMSRERARLLRGRLDEVLGRVDEAVPEYGAARAQFAGDSRAMEALALARGEIAGEPGFLRADPRVLRRTLAGMSQAERDLYRRGALDALRHEIESASPTHDLAGRITRREAPEMIERIRLLFDDEASFNAFMDDMGRERGMAEVRQFVGGGSPTARIQAEQADFMGNALPRVSELANPRNLAMRALDSGVAGRLRGLTEATADELAPFFTTPLDQGGADLIRQAIEAMRRREAQALPPMVGRLAGRGAAAGTGASVRERRD